MRLRPLAALVAMVMALSGIAIWVSGDGPRARAQQPPPTPPALTRPVPPRPVPPVALDRMALAVNVADQIAATTLDLVFKNSSDRPQEATLLLPVPAGAAISDLSLTVDDQTLEGELLGSDEAARIYTGIVQRQRDPALLEYVGLGLVRARVFPVPPGGESGLTVRFSQVLIPESGALRYRLPLSAGAEVGATVPKLTISARIADDRGVRSLFSPTHNMRVNRESDTVMMATHEETNAPPRGAFELNALLSGDEVAAGVISYRAAGEDGFFMLWLAPSLRQETVVEKDVMLVLDLSGSMSGRKIEQAKAALRFVLGRLNPGDRFNIVAFSSDVMQYASGLRAAAEAGQALAYVDRLQAEGGTNIDGALATALGGLDRERLTTVLFVTDGEPTTGERDPARILDHVRAAAPPAARLFVFGVGNDVNTLLLDGLAVQNHGDVTYVRPEEDVEEAVSGLYGRISSPQLTDLRLDMDGALAYDVYPRPVPDLFGGQTLFVTGRYRAPGDVTVGLTGNSRGGAETFAFGPLNLAESDRRASYLPRLWASRKVGALLRDIRLQGPERSRELIEEVTALGTRYGIVTPYTSFLAVEPGAQRGPTPVPAVPGGPTFARTPTPLATRAPTAVPVSGAPAVAAAATAGALARATPAPADSKTTGSGAATVQQVGDKSFVLRDGVWVDTAYQADVETLKVAFASDAYFDLVARIPDLAPFFALGERLIVVWEDVAYEVTG